jgi:hypothetical protein
LAGRSDPKPLAGEVMFTEKCTGFDSPQVLFHESESVLSAGVREIHAIAQSDFRCGCAWLALFAERDGADRIGCAGP